MGLVDSIKRRKLLKVVSDAIGKSERKLQRLDEAEQDKWINAYQTASRLFATHKDAFFKGYMGRKGIFDLSSAESFDIGAATKEIKDAISDYERASVWLAKPETLDDFILRGVTGRNTLMNGVQKREQEKTLLEAQRVQIAHQQELNRIYEENQMAESTRAVQLLHMFDQEEVVQEERDIMLAIRVSRMEKEKRDRQMLSDGISQVALDAYYRTKYMKIAMDLSTDYLQKDSTKNQESIKAAAFEYLSKTAGCSTGLEKFCLANDETRAIMRTKFFNEEYTPNGTYSSGRK